MSSALSRSGRLFPLLLPDPTIRLDRVEITPQAVTFTLCTTAPAALCPRCAQPARQVHSYYARSARDLPIHGRPAVLRLTARRFFGRNADCTRRVFCEPVPALLAKHARATTRLTNTYRHLGLALGGEPGSRLAAKLGMPTNPDTLLRRVKQARPTTTSAPATRVVGVDDGAMRKGQTYGTIVIDLERSAVLELLPVRDGGELKTSLGEHPEVEVLRRDRWASFADTAAEAGPPCPAGRRPLASAQERPRGPGALPRSVCREDCRSIRRAYLSSSSPDIRSGNGAARSGRPTG